MTERMTKLSIGPSYAKTLLAKNPINRRLSPDRVAVLVDALKAGQWKFNGESVILAEDGTLLDGQHRLAACVEANIPFETVVVFGVAKETFDTIDSGKTRSSADNLHIRGYKNANLLAGALRLRALYEAGQFTGTTAGIGGLVGAKSMAHGLLEIAKRSPDLQIACVAMSGRFKRAAKLITPSLGAFLFAEFAKQDDTAAECFFQNVETGEGLASQDPSFQLRERLMERQGAKRKISREEVAALTIKAWVAYRDSHPIRLLKYNMGPGKREAFPTWEYSTPSRKTATA